MTTTAGDPQSQTDTAPEAENAENAEHLTELRRRRTELLESVRALEQALAAPSRQMRWAERVSVALLELSGDFRDHVELTEGPTGLYSRLSQSSPRLSHAVARLTQEHKDLGAHIEELIDLLGQTEPSKTEAPEPGEPVVGDPDEVRQRGTTLITALLHHRQRGADLVWEAFSVDIGGQD